MARNTVEGGISSTSYRGLSSDNNIVILAMAFLLEPTLSTETFASLLAVILVVTGGLNLSTVPVPRIRGRAYYAVAAWTIGTVAVFANRLGEA
jgi:phosphatidylserine synthase